MAKIEKIPTFVLTLMLLTIIFPIISTSPLLRAVESTNQLDASSIKLGDSSDVIGIEHAASSSSGNDDNWVPFNTEEEPGVHPKILPKSRDTMGFCVDSNFFGMYKIPTTINEIEFHYLDMPSAGHTSEVGKPAVPRVTRFLEIPIERHLNSSLSVSLEVIYSESKTLDEYYVIPAQEPLIGQPSTEPAFEINDTFYEETNKFFPSDIVSLDGGTAFEPIIMRGRRIVVLNLFPVQFNPVERKVKVYSKIEVRLNFAYPVETETIDQRLYSENFEDLFANYILNYQSYYKYQWPPWSPFLRGGAENPEHPEYLIITNDTFFQQVQPLKDWKDKKGVPTKIVETSQIPTTTPSGPTADDIAAYIKNAYDTWIPAPSYVLLVGDSEFIPTFIKDVDGILASDLDYTTVDGNDYFPDMFLGRLCVDTTSEATTVIQKILDYERNPPTDPNFYSHVVACSQFEDEDGFDILGNQVQFRDGFEDRRFVLTSEEIRDFLENQQGYSVDRVYWARNPTGQNPTNYNNGPVWFYENGDPIPADLLVNNGFLWDGDNNDITDNITAGAFLVYHRDHGDITSWSHPQYTTADIAGLTNGDLLPVVFSVECQCGWFDHPTTESFCEEFVRQPNGGAVAAFGATRNSYSGYNDAMIKGFIDAIWPDFDLNYASGGLFSLGQILIYGKVYMAHTYSDHIWRAGWVGGHSPLNRTFHLFHLFGDPEMPIWTAQPSELTVIHPSAIGSGGSQKFVVSVKNNGDPVHHAKVCLQKSTDVYCVEYTDPSGYAYFDITPSSSGQMDITITKHNYRPYEGSISVTSSGATLTVDPVIGPSGITVTLQGSSFSNGELVDIYFGGSTVDITATASGGSFTESYIVPSEAEGPVNVVAVGKTSGRTAITLFRRLPDQPLPDPYIYCQWDSSTWHLNPADNDPIWNNPDIRLYEFTTNNPVSSYSLTVGATYRVKAHIHNDATVDATNTKVTFEWAFWGAGQTTWHSFGTDTITVAAGGEEIAEALWTPSITGHSCIRITIDHPFDENLENNKGQENTVVHPVSSPVEIEFDLSNPTDVAALIYLEARQADTGQSIWQAQIKREYPQVQEPGQKRTVSLVVEAPENAVEGSNRIFIVNAYIGDELIGGIEILVCKGNCSQHDLETWLGTVTTTTMTITSTNTTTSMGTSETEDTYGFEFYVLLAAVGTFVVMRRKRKQV